ncbi:hypothetical protein [Kitasatospora albolonga]|uniref:hypothetical protein n=1 Tax=Kitasatospora albolonga TaxID=68173 RepID=UPI0031F044C0
MSSPPSGGPPRPAAPAGGSAATADPLPSTAGPATIPGPRVRRVGLLLPWYPYVRAEQLLRRARALRYPALSSALAAFRAGRVRGADPAAGAPADRDHRAAGRAGAGRCCPLPFVLGALAWLNQTARVPLRHTLFCLAWGACAATTVALLANGWAGDFLIARQGSVRGETLLADVATTVDRGGGQGRGAGDAAAAGAQAAALPRGADLRGAGPADPPARPAGGPGGPGAAPVPAARVPAPAAAGLLPPSGADRRGGGPGQARARWPPGWCWAG